MPRAHTFELTTDTSHFTPLQLQPRNLLSTGFNALSQWLRANWASFPDLHLEAPLLGRHPRHERRVARAAEVL